jgi:surface antigen
MGMTYPAVGNSLAEKAAIARKHGSAPKIGSVVLTSENKTNGHVAYVIGRNQQGWVLAESNYGLNGKVNYGRVIPYNSQSILGFINPIKKG